MRNEPLSTRLRLVLVTCAALLSLGSAVQAQQADEDDEDSFEQRVIKNILGGMGVDVGRPGIDYRERSPLVIPPTLDLPPPTSAGLAASNPAWPREAVQKKKVVKRANARATGDDPGNTSVMTPEELNRGITPRAARPVDARETNRTTDLESGRPLRPGELKSGSIFTWDNLMGTNRDTAKFTGEPTRGALTQPPPGYQTPSANQPYAAGEERGGGWKIPSILDRPVGSN
jgi:hypothetical protein